MPNRVRGGLWGRIQDSKYTHFNEHGNLRGWYASATVIVLLGLLAVAVPVAVLVLVLS